VPCSDLTDAPAHTADRPEDVPADPCLARAVRAATPFLPHDPTGYIQTLIELAFEDSVQAISPPPQAAAADRP
jgi:hypothetical protein